MSIASAAVDHENGLEVLEDAIDGSHRAIKHRQRPEPPDNGAADVGLDFVDHNFAQLLGLACELLHLYLRDVELELRDGGYQDEVF